MDDLLRGKPSGLLRVLAEKLGGIGFAALAAGHGQHEIGKDAFGAANSWPFSSRKTSAAAAAVRLLPSTKGWFGRGDRCRRGHFKQVAVQEYAVQGRRRHPQCGLEQTQITGSWIAAVSGDLVLMHFHDFGQREESDGHGLFRQFLEIAGVLRFTFSSAERNALRRFLP